MELSTHKNIITCVVQVSVIWPSGILYTLVLKIFRYSELWILIIILTDVCFECFRLCKVKIFSTLDEIKYIHDPPTLPEGLLRWWNASVTCIQVLHFLAFQLLHWSLQTLTTPFPAFLCRYRKPERFSSPAYKSFVFQVNLMYVITEDTRIASILCEHPETKQQTRHSFCLTRYRSHYIRI